MTSILEPIGHTVLCIKCKAVIYPTLLSREYCRDCQKKRQAYHEAKSRAVKRLKEKMSETKETIKCQSCIERQMEDIHDAIGLYMNLPICDLCLGFIMANKENVNEQAISIPSDSNTLERRLNNSLLLLDQFESVFDNFPMTAEEVLEQRDQFYNHRAPAIINCTNEQIKLIINRRKAVLFAIRIKDERWSTIIEQLRNEERAAKGLTGVAKSIKEKAKKPSGQSDEQKKKLAKMLGITVAQLDAMGADARVAEFGDLVGTKETKKAVDKDDSAKQVLKGIQDKIAGKENKPRINPITGKAY